MSSDIEIIVHPDDATRIVLAAHPETTVARTTMGMFSEADNAAHAQKLVDAVTTHSRLVAELRKTRAALQVAASAELFGPDGIIDLDVLEAVQETARKALEGGDE